VYGEGDPQVCDRKIHDGAAELVCHQRGQQLVAVQERGGALVIVDL